MREFIKDYFKEIFIGIITIVGLVTALLASINYVIDKGIENGYIVRVISDEQKELLRQKSLLFANLFCSSSGFQQIGYSNNQDISVICRNQDRIDMNYESIMALEVKRD